MKGREFRYRLAVYQDATVVNEYGGRTLSETKMTDSWASVASLPRDRFTAYGLDQSKMAIRIKLRTRKDFDYEKPGVFFRFQGKKWIPKSIQLLDFNDQLIEIIATNT